MDDLIRCARAAYNHVYGRPWNFYLIFNKKYDIIFIQRLRKEKMRKINIDKQIDNH